MRTFIFVAAMAAGLISGCSREQTSPQVSVESKAPPAAKERKVYSTRGVVKELESLTKAKISHEEIPGFMAAMTMSLDVKNTNELAGVTVGDQITFDMVVTDDDGWIENVKRIGTAPIEAAKTNDLKNFRRVRDVDPLAVGDVMPDYPFITEDGKTLRLSELKGQAVAFTFIFTRCPFPTFCPRMNSNFETAARQLSKPGSPTNWHFISISFDTEVDTPEVLKKYAARLERNPAKWNFVTGEQIEIDAITEQFGLIFSKRSGTIDHNLRTVIVDANSRIRQIYIGNEWSVDEFVAEMTKAAEGKP